MLDPATLTTLRQFRAGVYACFGARCDALFELLNAATVAGLVPSLAYLSLSPVHRRRWGSLYDALVVGVELLSLGLLHGGHNHDVAKVKDGLLEELECA